jgi:hypothetical protein
MSSPNIRSGIWTRRVPWAQGQFWRTDISFSVLNDPWVHTARYILKDGPIVDVPMTELRAALDGAPTRKGGTIVGPYNLDPFAKTIHGTPVQMSFGPFADLDLDDVAAIHRASPKGRRMIRPPVSQPHREIAKTLLQRVRAQQLTFDQLVSKIEKQNPAVRVCRDSDGGISIDELAYMLRVDAHREWGKTVPEQLLKSESPRRDLPSPQRSEVVKRTTWLQRLWSFLCAFFRRS